MGHGDRELILLASAASAGDLARPLSPALAGTLLTLSDLFLVTMIGQDSDSLAFQSAIESAMRVSQCRLENVSVTHSGSSHFVRPLPAAVTVVLPKPLVAIEETHYLCVWNLTPQHPAGFLCLFAHKKKAPACCGIAGCRQCVPGNLMH